MKNHNGATNQTADNPVSIQIMSLLIAILATFFGPLIQLHIAKRQIRASVLSSNRQQWIDRLREQIANFITIISELNTHAQFKHLDISMVIQKTREMHFCHSKITLMLNPEEPDHIKLIELLKSAKTGITKTSEENNIDIPAIVALSQSIFKNEWKRVKSGN